MGRYLTQKASAVSDEERIFAKSVSGASPMLDLDWREAEDEEVAAWQEREREQAERDAQILAEQETEQQQRIEQEQEQDADDILKYK